MEINGDLPAQSIKARHVRLFKDTLLKCPSRVPQELQGLPILKSSNALKAKGRTLLYIVILDKA